MLDRVIPWLSEILVTDLWHLLLTMVLSVDGWASQELMIVREEKTVEIASSAPKFLKE